jgi:hypothetical protein
MTGALSIKEENSVEHLLNNRLQMKSGDCNCGLCKANKTNENRSVRTGQGELANRRLRIYRINTT